MSTTLIVDWILWGMTLLAGAGAIGALFRLRLAERSLPAWSELKGLDARLPLLREEQRQAGEAAAARRQELAKLEDKVAPLRQLREWQEANPDAPARLQQLMTDLAQGQSELSASQQNVCQLRKETAQLTEQALALRKQAGSLEEQKKEINARLPLLREEQRQAGEAAAARRQELAKLEDKVAPLRQLREWQEANPDAPARLQQLMTDLAQGQSELSASQQKFAEEAARRSETAQDLQRLMEEKAQLAQQILALQTQVDSLEKQKAEMAALSTKASSRGVRRKPKA